MSQSLNESRLHGLVAHRQELAKLLETHLAIGQQEGRSQLRENERGMMSELRQLDARIKHQESEVRRSGMQPGGAVDQLSKRIHDSGGHAGVPRGAHPINTAGRLAPLNFGEQQLRRMQEAAMRGENCRIVSEQRDFSTADPLLPASLFPYPIAAIHESRLLDRLPGYAVETPSVTFIRHISTTGVPAAVEEANLKPELTFNTDALTATAVKLAAHNGCSFEIISDWPSFQTYCGTELYRQIIDLENQLLIAGNSSIDVYSGAGYEFQSPVGMQGLLATPGILQYNAAVDTGGSGSTLLSSLDSFEKAIATLRTGPALATPDLIVMSVDTWSAVRRIKDGFGHFMVQPDPTAGQANQLWGVDVLQTTQCPQGEAILIDTSKFGYVAIREPLSMRIGYTGDDFTHNILRTVAEERLVLCVTRPPAILQIINLPQLP